MITGGRARIRRITCAQIGKPRRRLLGVQPVPGLYPGHRCHRGMRYSARGTFLIWSHQQCPVHKVMCPGTARSGVQAAPGLTRDIARDDPTLQGITRSARPGRRTHRDRRARSVGVWGLGPQEIPGRKNSRRELNAPALPARGFRQRRGSTRISANRPPRCTHCYRITYDDACPVGRIVTPHARRGSRRSRHRRRA